MADYDDENLDETNGSEQGESDDSTEIDRTDETSGQDEAEMHVEDADSESGEELEERDEEQDAKVLAQLQHQVTTSPYEYDSHIQLIQLARICGELDILRVARQRMSEIFPLTEELWKAWIEDETKVLDKTNVEEVGKINVLYERAVQDYLSVDLWLDYAIFNLTDFSSDEALQPVRGIFERAIMAVGLHVPKGNMLWNSFREIEQGYLGTLFPSPGEILTKDKQAKYQKQVERVKDIFRRQLSIPLIGIESTFEEYMTFIGQEIDPVIQKIFTKSKAKLDLILPFEQKLEAANESEKYGIFISYIEHEREAREPVRVTILFERALIAYCLSADLWAKYLDFLDRQLKVADLALSAHERSVRNLPWTLDLWMSYLRAVEYFKQNESIVKGIFDRAYTNGCTLPSHYVEIWLAYLSYLRRQLPIKPHMKTDENSTSTPEVDALRKVFITAVADVETKEADSENKLERYWADVEAGTLHDVVKGRGLWDKIMKSHQRDSGYWLAYYRFERLFGDETRCRKLLKKAVLRNLDNIDVVAVEFMQFEAEMGSLEDWMEAHHFCKDSIKRVAERQAKLEKVAALESAKQAAPKKNFRLRDSYEDNREMSHDRPRGERPERSSLKDARDTRPTGDKRKRSEEDQPGLDHDGFKVPALPTPATAKKQKLTNASDISEEPKKIPLSSETPEGNKEERTVFLSNLSYNTTEQSVWELFHTAGEIRDIRFGKDLRGKSRGFCYLEFVKIEGAQEALKLDRRDLDGRPVFVSKDSKDQRESHFKGTGGEEKNKLFIRGLQTRVTNDDLKQFFEKFGTLKDVRVVTHKNGISKGIAYVEFSDSDTANKALEETNGKEILGKPMIVAISNPPAHTAKPRFDTTNFDASKPFRPIVVPPPDGQRKSRSHVDLVPRSVLKKQINAEINQATVASSETAASLDQASTLGGAKRSNDDFRALFKKK